MKKLLTILLVLISFSTFAQFEAGEYINSDTVKIDGVPLLLNTFKQGNLGGTSNIFYSTGASSQPASGSLNQVVGGGLLNANAVVKYDGTKLANSIITEATKQINIEGVINTNTEDVIVASKNKYRNLLSYNNSSVLKFQDSIYSGGVYIANIGYGFGNGSLYNNSGASSNGFGAYSLLNNSGVNSNGFGAYSLQNNTGANSNGFGYASLLNNSGVNSNGFGAYSLQNNTGANSNGFGYASLQNNTGANSNGFGYASLLNNSGANSNGFGLNSLQNNTGANSNGFGNGSLQNNSGANSNGFGAYSLLNNSGANSNGFGAYSLLDNSGVNSNGFGYASLQNNTGANSNGFGYASLRSNTGINSNGFGYGSLRYNNYSNVLSIGHQTTVSFIEEPTSTKSFTDLEITTNTITFTAAHGFGSTGSKVNLKFKTVTGTAPTGLVNNSIYQFTITSATVLTLSGIGTNASLDFQGSLTKNVDITNSIAIGTDVNATKQNQIVLGGSSYVETLLFGKVGINQTIPSEALDVNGNIMADTIKARKQFISLLPTGTPPLVVASTTKVDNLNVSFLEGHPASYFETANVNIQRHITNDNDTIIGNEYQNISNSKTGNNVTVNISNGTGTTFSVADADSSITNEIQDLSRSNDTLFLSLDATPVILNDFQKDSDTLTFDATLSDLADSSAAIRALANTKASVSGTNNFIPKITGANTLGNSFLLQEGSFLKTNVDFKFEKSAPGFYFKDSHSSYSGFFYVYDSIFGIQKRDYITDAFISRPYAFSLAAPPNTINVNNLGNVAFGHGTALAKLHPISTGTQARLGYDANKYTDLSTGSTGNLTIDPTGDTVKVVGAVNSTGGFFKNGVEITGGSSSMVYPLNSGIVTYNGTTWGTSITNNSTLWNQAYDKKIVSAAFSGTSTKTLTLYQQDGNVLQASFTDESGDSGSMVYPPAGIAKSTGTGWATSITDNSSNWNNAYTYRLTSASGTSPLTLSLSNNTLTGSLSSQLTSFGTLTPSIGYLYWNGSAFSYATPSGSSKWTSDTYGINYQSGNVGIGINSVSNGKVNISAGTNTRGIIANSTNHTAVDGIATTGSGISGTSDTGSGVYGNSNTGYGGFFEGLGCKATKYYVSSLNTAPSSATATGTTGEIRFTSGYIYVCVATNTWKRTQISTW